MTRTNRRIYSTLASYLNGLLVVAVLGAADRVVCNPANNCPNFLLFAPFAVPVLVVALVASLRMALIRDGLTFLALHFQVFVLSGFVSAVSLLLYVGAHRVFPALKIDGFLLRFALPVALGLVVWLLFLSGEVRRTIVALSEE